MSAFCSLSNRSFKEAKGYPRKSALLFLALFLAWTSWRSVGQELPRSSEYEDVQHRLAQGWNTWDTHSVISQVLLPSGLAIRMGIQRNSAVSGEAFLPEALIGRRGAGVEEVFPGPHSWDGSYTDLRLTWHGISVRVQTAHAGNDLVMLVTPLPSEKKAHLPATMVFSVAYLWNQSGTVERLPDHIEAQDASRRVSIYSVGGKAPIANLPIAAPYLSASLDAPCGISTGHRRALAEIQGLIDRQRLAYEASIAKAGANRIVVDAIETTLGWDTIYEPEHHRVVSPVSRVWNVDWGGYVIFDWDTFFAASLAAVGDRELAYADALETLREETSAGFVPNYARARGWKSFDRSEPPVGAITVLSLYNQFHDQWFLRDAFAPLLTWNRWWQQHRGEGDYLVWGSDGENKPRNPDDESVGKRQGAIFESGLDNSPMYDDAVFESKTGHLLIADVGLMSEYIADCDALAKIAGVLGEVAAEKELQDRAEFYRKSLRTLWDEPSGYFLNKDVATGKLNPRTSPTNFYPLLARAASPEQARRMVKEHLLNPDEFWGKWVLPSTPRNDPAFHDQNYWRGRIWGPMNYLVYLGLRNYDLPEARKGLAAKSLELFLFEWTEKGHVHENYNGATGEGDDVMSSDRFYHWGALLGLIPYLESIDAPRSVDFVP